MKPPRKTPPRLPDGAEFGVKFFDKEGVWAGFLEADGRRVCGTARAVFSLLAKLDREWRRKGERS